MKCPICHSEMQPGGLTASGQWVLWYPEPDCKEHTLKQLFRKTCKKLGHPSWDNSTRIDNAFYCQTCDKIIGFFDIVHS